MSPEAQRIAIAELCGWYIITDDEDEVAGAVWSLRAPSDTTHYPWHRYGADCWLDGPDYLNDLNAMHEAEKTLSSGQRQAYALHLARLCDRSTWHAIAAQRAEAFLRTLDLWK